jgi:hypothetical protein
LAITPAGDIFLFTANGTRFQQVSIAGRALKQEEISVEFEAMAEVLDVDTSNPSSRLPTESGAALNAPERS